jgi:hypothetical protein
MITQNEHIVDPYDGDIVHHPVAIATEIKTFISPTDTPSPNNGPQYLPYSILPKDKKETNRFWIWIVIIVALILLLLCVTLLLIIWAITASRVIDIHNTAWNIAVDNHTVIQHRIKLPIYTISHGRTKFTIAGRVRSNGIVDVDDNSAWNERCCRQYCCSMERSSTVTRNSS